MVKVPADDVILIRVRLFSNTIVYDDHPIDLLNLPHIRLPHLPQFGRPQTFLCQQALNTVMDEIYQRADAFLFGRLTYEIFAGSWGTWDDPGDSPIWTALNTKPKYVASTTLTDPRWTNTTVLSSEVAAAVRELKAKPGRELQVHGSGALFRWLLDNDLVDEMTLFTFPVVVGQGTRLFPDTGRDRALELVESRATPSGVTIQVYRFTGRPQYETATPDLNT
jgi:dihydrofolate reductase